MRFGFVNMETKEQAAAAVAALDGQHIDGARVKVGKLLESASVLCIHVTSANITTATTAYASHSRLTSVTRQVAIARPKVAGGDRRPPRRDGYAGRCDV
jgi:RNA recognition motif-containing protein